MPRPRDLERHDSRASLRREAALWQGSPGSQLIHAQESGCRSSVVEHSLGKGEVVSSILTGSTRILPSFRPVARSRPREAPFSGPTGNQRRNTLANSSLSRDDHIGCESTASNNMEAPNRGSDDDMPFL